jgi:hypothetical protein
LLPKGINTTWESPHIEVVKMSEVTGVVQAMSNKFDKFSILLDNDVWYSSKFDISCNKGDTVLFEDGGKKYCQRLKVVTEGAGGSTHAVTPRASTSGGGGGGTTAARIAGFPVPLDTKDRSIVRQNSLTHATAVVLKAYVENDTYAKPDDLARLVVETARIFEDYSCGDSDGEAARKLLDANEGEEDR